MMKIERADGEIIVSSKMVPTLPGLCVCCGEPTKRCLTILPPDRHQKIFPPWVSWILVAVPLPVESLFSKSSFKNISTVSIPQCKECAGSTRYAHLAWRALLIFSLALFIVLIFQVERLSETQIFWGMGIAVGLGALSLGFITAVDTRTLPLKLIFDERGYVMTIHDGFLRDSFERSLDQLEEDVMFIDGHPSVPGVLTARAKEPSQTEPTQVQESQPSSQGLS